ncbi:MAG: shikimate kinase [Planctomycetaceae bacterium]
MLHRMIVTLIGYRGCGKSSVGPLIAAALNCECIDSDDRVEAVAGKSIQRIFAEDGEPVFRQLETDVLRQVYAQSPVVVSAGGGAILAAANRQMMSSAGPVVWLRATVDTLAARITGDDSSATRRPSLTGRSVVDEVADVLEVRTPLYREVATLVVDADTQTPQQIANHVLAELTSLNEGRSL